jgi:type III pantothenate kinase
MNLVIDIGNTRSKLAVVNNNKVVHVEIVEKNNLYNTVVNLVNTYNLTQGIIAHVSAVDTQELKKIESCIKLMQLTKTTPIPFNNLYATPATLGVDRIALAAWAATYSPQQNVLVIDAGTCITYDFVDANANYYGGAISPGLQLRYNALNNYTQNLPLLTPQYIENFVGNTTESSIHSGVVHGLINEIDGFINNYKQKNGNLTVVLTGGDANFLVKRLKNTIFANPNILLLGLNAILNYNIN